MPRHGSSWRSMDLRVPRGRSRGPWSGTVAKHVPARTRTWEPFCRTTSPPFSRMTPSTSRAVTNSSLPYVSALAYLDRQRQATGRRGGLSLAPGACRRAPSAPSLAFPSREYRTERKRGELSRARHPGLAPPRLGSLQRAPPAETSRRLPRTLPPPRPPARGTEVTGDSGTPVPRSRAASGSRHHRRTAAASSSGCLRCA